jgi:hypothetical protein
MPSMRDHGAVGRPGMAGRLSPVVSVTVGARNCYRVNSARLIGHGRKPNATTVGDLLGPLRA